VQTFADFWSERLANEYDLIVIDHPHVGVVAREGLLVALDELGPKGTLETLTAQSLGGSHETRVSIPRIVFIQSAEESH
jgi:multiple sugar transport system substrate-binding protein